MDIRELGQLMQDARRKTNQDRKKSGLKPLGQQEIADSLSVNKITVSKWERGEIEPGASKLLAYCRTIGVTPDELLGLKKNACCSS